MKKSVALILLMVFLTSMALTGCNSATAATNKATIIISVSNGEVFDWWYTKSTIYANNASVYFKGGNRIYGTVYILPTNMTKEQAKKYMKKRYGVAGQLADPSPL